MDALAGRRAVLTTLHREDHADRNTITGRWEIAEDFTHYTTDFDLFYRRVLT
ncbi:MAG: hypothetical protein ACRDVN_07835 [Jiangellaceae bacterium]